MATIKYKDPVTGEWKYAGGGSTECDIVIEDDGAGNVTVVDAVDVTGQSKEMKTLNGYEVVDAKTREDVAQLSEAVQELQKEDDDAPETVEYRYDGDIDSDEYTWILKTAGNKGFVKVADIPDGEINLVGGHVEVICSDNAWRNYSFDITEDMLTASVDYNGWILPAQVSGLTQIFYQDTRTSDTSLIAVVLICTKAGVYNIAFNGWGEVLTVPEKGIYFMDNREYGGSKYASSMVCTVMPSGGAKKSPAEYDGNEIQVFTRGLCIGDSITAGSFNHSDGEIANKKYSYPSALKRITGVEVVNAGVAGLTSKTWYDASLDSGTQWGRWVNNEWVWNENPTVGESDKVSTALDYSGYDFAVIHLGINDIGMMGDATLDETISIFASSINNIINKLKTESAGIKVFLATIIPSYATPGNTTYKTLNDKIREIANAADDVYLVDLNLYSECAASTPYSNGHLTAIGYHRMASEIKSIISYTINQNLADFKEVQFIGTDYHI